MGTHKRAVKSLPRLEFYSGITTYLKLTVFSPSKSVNSRIRGPGSSPVRYDPSNTMLSTDISVVTNKLASISSCVFACTVNELDAGVKLPLFCQDDSNVFTVAL